VALPRLQKMVRAAEERVGLYPRRRTELVEQRLKKLEQTIAQHRCWLSVQLDKVQGLHAQLATLPHTSSQLEAKVTALEAAYRERARAEKPHSKLAKVRRRLASARKKLNQAPMALQKAQQTVATHQARLADLRTEYEELTAHLIRLQDDNAQNDDPVRIIVRVDAGFGTGPNITWLLEMGYTVYTKAHNAQVTASLLKQLTPESKWRRVGKNAEMVGFGERHITHCPYPLTVALERFHTPRGVNHGALIAYRDDGQCLTLSAWFDFYNARQIIEAGVKETNVVFKMHPLKMRSKGGIALQEQFTLFAANFVRWAAAWLRQRVCRTTPRFDDALTRVKAMVRVVANTSAWVGAEGDTLLVRFDETGAYPDVELRLNGAWRTCPPILPHKKVQKPDFGDGFPSGCT
jgi:cell division protein FtsB